MVISGASPAQREITLEYKGSLLLWKMGIFSASNVEGVIHHRRPQGKYGNVN
jgi:hypothetical protein